MNNLAITVPLVLAALLVVHHWYIHGNLAGTDRFFQASDADSHEAWILLLLGISLGAYVMSPGVC
jgi:hypothetical protein